MADVAARCFPTCTVDDQEADAVRHGRPLDAVILPAEQTALIDRHGAFLALYRRTAAGATGKPFSIRRSPTGGEDLTQCLHAASNWDRERAFQIVHAGIASRTHKHHGWVPVADDTRRRSAY